MTVIRGVTRDLAILGEREGGKEKKVTPHPAKPTKKDACVSLSHLPILNVTGGPFVARHFLTARLLLIRLQKGTVAFGAKLQTVVEEYVRYGAPPPPQKKGQVSKENSRFVLLPGTPFLCVKLLSLIISIGAHRSRGGRHGAGCTGCRAVEGKKRKVYFICEIICGERRSKFKFNGEKKRQSIPSIIEFGIFSQFSLRPKLGIANLNQYRVWQAAKKPLGKCANLYKEKRRRSAHLKIKRCLFSLLRTQKRRLLFLSVRHLGTLSVRNKRFSPVCLGNSAHMLNLGKDN